MLIQLPIKPKKPEHIGKALQPELREYRIQYIFNYYDKMHNSTIISCPFLIKMVTNKKKVLPVILSFEVKITDVMDFYELKCRMCAIESRMIEGQDYKISYYPIADGESLRFMIVMVSEKDKE